MKRDSNSVTTSPTTASRTPWRSRPPAERVDDSLADILGTLDIAPAGRGPSGPRAGRVFHRLRLRAQEETTAQIAGTYPFVAEHGFTADGTFIGRDRFTRGAFRFDPFELYRAGLLPNPNVAIFGTIGSGKSSLIKTMALRLLAFGVRFINPADTKGEMAPLARAVGATLVQLGPGMGKALNPLYAPERPAGIDERMYIELMEQQRLLLLNALGATASGRPLTAREETGIEQALAQLTRQSDHVAADRMRQPNLAEFSELMLNPTQAMADAIPVPLSVLADDCLDLALRFRAMVKGALKGIFDGQTVEIDWNRPGVVIDISRIRSSDAGVALTMTCGQALVDQILTFTDDQWVRILDECWRQIRYPHIVRRISEGQKLARGDDVTSGSATMIALHRISDLMGAAPEVRELALGLLADCSTRIVYNQADDQVPITRSTLNLTDIEAELLPRLPQATALWKVAQRSFVVDHTVLRDGYEWDLIQTDSRMGSRKYETVDDPREAMASEVLPDQTPDDAEGVA
ncbi:conjugal transfer protein TraC [Microlunatus sp. Gsoil 973]|uniref:conjugal transfer protein TraC n=1 Tax=Microlunatus sp. Gsoil 973 TaxID=2672569 RepID=UPI0012B4DA7C|nr:conjugal transfer protein TraC [Microlunatus sp. Gsoil 973]QGN34481.1 conjugal transfer protein TraC [Microlunatus sp. Gsoil 973]